MVKYLEKIERNGRDFRSLLSVENFEPSSPRRTLAFWLFSYVLSAPSITPSQRVTRLRYRCKKNREKLCLSSFEEITDYNVGISIA